MHRVRSFLYTHKTLLISTGFLVLFSFAVARATPPTSPYDAGTTLDPQCAPGTPNCSVATYIQNSTTQQVGANFNIDGSGTVGGTFTNGSIIIPTVNPSGVGTPNTWNFTQGNFVSPDTRSKLFLYQTGTTGAAVPKMQFRTGGGGVAWNGQYNDAPGWLVLDYNYTANPYSVYYLGGANGLGKLGSFTTNSTYALNYITQGVDALNWDIAGNITIPNGSMTVSNLTASDLVFTDSTKKLVSISVGSGLTNASSTLTNNLITGKSGGQTVLGGLLSTDSLTLRSTSGIGAAGADIIFQTGNNGGSEDMRILNNGNVGIGTTAPGSRLNVVLPDGTNTILSSALGATGASTGIEFNYGGGVGGNLKNISRIVGVAENGGGGDLLFQTAATGSTAYSTKMEIFRDGSTGILNSLNVGALSSATSTLDITSPTAATNTVNSVLLSRYMRLTTASVKWGNAMDVLLGSYGTALNSQSRVDFKLANGFSNIPDTTVLTLQANGNVGIGTTAPSGVLTLAGSQTAAAWGLSGIDFQTVAANYNDSSSTAGTVTNNMVSSFGIPTLSATNSGVTYTNAATLYVAGAPVAGTNATITNPYALYVSSGLSQFGNSAVTTGTTVATFQNAGGTCSIVPSTSGGVTCSSDMNLKKNITDLSDGSAWSFNANVAPASQSVLDKVLALTPVDYNWKIESDTDPKHAGFIAQEVRQVFPDLVMTDPKTGLLSLNYTGLVPYTVEAIQEMNLNISNISDLSRPNDWRDSLTSWFANTTNGIGDFVAGTFRAKNELCINQTCVTETQLKQLLQNSQGGGSTTVIGSGTSASGSDSSSSADSGQSQSPDVQSPEVTAPVVTSDPSDTSSDTAQDQTQSPADGS